MVYKFREGFGANGIPAEVVGAELDRIKAEHAETLTPHVVLDAARDPESVLHPYFEWDDESAAESHRAEQARRLIRSVYVVHIDDEGNERPVLGYVNVPMPEVGRVYVTTARAMGDDELRASVEEEAMRALEGWKARYRHLCSLAPVFAAIERAERKVVRVRRRREQPVGARA